MEIWDFLLVGVSLVAVTSIMYSLLLIKRQNHNCCKIIVDLSGEIIKASSSFYEFLGVEENSIRNHFIYDFVHPQDKAKLGWDGDSIQFSLLKKEGVAVRIIDHQGEFNWVKVRGSKKFSLGQDVISYTIQLDPVWTSQLNKLEGELWLKDYLLDQIPMNIYIKNLDSQKIYINQAELNYTGLYSKDQVIGKSDWELYPKETAQISIEEDEVIFETELPIQGEIKQNIRYDSAPIWFHTSKFPIRKNGNLIGLFGMSYDITDLVKKDQEIEEKNKRLTNIQRELKNRIRELNSVNKSLKDSKSQAENLLQANNKFLSRFSHEIKTPVHSIKGFAYLLSQTELDPKQKQFLSYLITSSNSLNLLIDKVFNFSSFELGISKLNLDRVNLKSFCDEVFQDLKRLGEKKTQLHYSYEFDPSLDIEVEIDSLRLKLILGNLFSNAVNYTSAGSIFFRVKAIASDSIRKAYRIEIEDTGEGIPTDHLEMIFDPFYHKEEQSTNPNAEHGMGLSVCNSILKAMNSKLHVESKVGKGTIFHFDLPVEKQ